ncbi:MAG: DUF6883 domain-containing protein [Candidatus Manganitrophaceae bacterium]
MAIAENEKVRLPNADQAQVDREKITGYLLSATHPDGASKAKFFARFGFYLEDWEVLRAALWKHGVKYAVVKTVESAFGTRYSVEGALETPDGRNPRIRTIWLVEKGSAIPRLITAYPY